MESEVLKIEGFQLWILNEIIWDTYLKEIFLLFNLYKSTFLTVKEEIRI
jgi:hypothetical protein